MVPMFLSLLIVSAIYAYASDHIIDGYNDCNCVMGGQGFPSISKFATLLGNFQTLSECQTECINKKCDSYTYYDNGDKSLNHNCYGYINNTLWMPYSPKQENIYCGRIIYPCKSNIDCSLNGVCDTQTGNCTCNPSWNGYKCGNLTLLPATKGTGYNWTDINDGQHTSSWGGSVQYNREKNVYEMFAAEMTSLSIIHNILYTCTSNINYMHYTLFRSLWHRFLAEEFSNSTCTIRSG